MTVISPPRVLEPQRSSAPDGASSRADAFAPSGCRRPHRGDNDRLLPDRRRVSLTGHRYGCESSAPQPCVRLQRWARLTLTITVVFTAVWLGAKWLGGGSAAPATTSVSTVTVQSGESLWQIAGRVAPGADTRLMVQQIRDLNDLGPGDGLVPGVQLTVPATG